MTVPKKPKSGSGLWCVGQLWCGGQVSKVGNDEVDYWRFVVAMIVNADGAMPTPQHDSVVIAT